eukprot:g1941.t1
MKRASPFHRPSIVPNSAFGGQRKQVTSNPFHRQSIVPNTAFAGQGKQVNSFLHRGSITQPFASLSSKPRSFYKSNKDNKGNKGNVSAAKRLAAQKRLSTVVANEAAELLAEVDEEDINEEEGPQTDRDIIALQKSTIQVLCQDVDGMGGSFGLFAYILEYLDWESVISVASTCTTWYRAVTHIPPDSFLRRGDRLLHYYEYLFSRRWPKEYAYLSHDGYYHDWFFYYFHRYFGFLDGFQLYIPILKHMDRKLLCCASTTNPQSTIDEIESLHNEDPESSLRVRYPYFKRKNKKRGPHLFPSATSSFDPRFLPNVSPEETFERVELIDQIMEALVGWVYTCGHAKRGIAKIIDESEQEINLSGMVIGELIYDEITTENEAKRNDKKYDDDNKDEKKNDEEYELTKEDLQIIHFDIFSQEVTVWMDIRDRLAYLCTQLRVPGLKSMVTALKMNDFDTVNENLIETFEDLSCHLLRCFDDASSCSKHMQIAVQFAEELCNFAKLPHEFAADLGAIFRTFRYAVKSSTYYGKIENLHRLMGRWMNALCSFIRSHCDLRDLYYCLVHIASLVLEGDGAGAQDFGDDDTVTILETNVTGCGVITERWCEQIEDFCKHVNLPSEKYVDKMQLYKKTCREVQSVVHVVEQVEELLKCNALEDDDEDELEKLIELLVQDEEAYRNSISLLKEHGDRKKSAIVVRATQLDTLGLDEVIIIDAFSRKNQNQWAYALQKFNLFYDSLKPKIKKMEEERNLPSLLLDEKNNKK